MIWVCFNNWINGIPEIPWQTKTDEDCALDQSCQTCSKQQNFPFTSRKSKSCPVSGHRNVHWLLGSPGLFRLFSREELVLLRDSGDGSSYPISFRFGERGTLLSLWLSFSIERLIICHYYWSKGKSKPYIVVRCCQATGYPGIIFPDPSKNKHWATQPRITNCSGRVMTHDSE